LFTAAQARESARRPRGPREAIRNNLRQFIDKGFTAHHDVVEYWDSPLLKVFHGKVGMKFDDPSIKPVRPTDAFLLYG
jgi:hypothetical protein